MSPSSMDDEKKTATELIEQRSNAASISDGDKMETGQNLDRKRIMRKLDLHLVRTPRLWCGIDLSLVKHLAC